jgi:hypothetical protein
MVGMSRREFLRYTGLVAAVSTIGVPALASERVSDYSEKRKVISEMMQEVVDEKEKMQRYADLNYDTSTLAHAMIHDKTLWDGAKPGQDHIVGVAERREQGILVGSKHYFSTPKECQTFQIECAKQGKASYFRSRNQRPTFG